MPRTCSIESRRRCTWMTIVTTRSLGNQVLADFIAASILDAPGPWKDRVN